MSEVKTYGRFYAVLKQLPGADKETLVEQFTNGRTVHLHEMSAEEYRRMCEQMESVAGYDARKAKYRQSLRRQRSACLHALKDAGVDTGSWSEINRYCKSPKIAGKEFRELKYEELEQLQRKLRMIARKRKMAQ